MELWVPVTLLVDLNALVPWWHQPPEQLIRLCISYFPPRESLLLLAVCGKLLLLSLLICVLVSKCLSLSLFLRHQDYLNCVTFTLSSGIHCNENTQNITKKSLSPYVTFSKASIVSRDQKNGPVGHAATWFQNYKCTGWPICSQTRLCSHQFLLRLSWGGIDVNIT